MLVFDKIQFKLVAFSKKIMKNIIEDQINTKSYLFPKHTDALNLIDENGNRIDSYFRQIFSLKGVMTAMIYERNFEVGEVVL